MEDGTWIEIKFFKNLFLIPVIVARLASAVIMIDFSCFYVYEGFSLASN